MSQKNEKNNVLEKSMNLVEKDIECNRGAHPEYAESFGNNIIS